MAFELYGTKGAVSWNLEKMNELQVYLTDDEGRAPRGYTTVFGGDRYPYHGAFVPGDANSIGFEDLVAIEDHEFLSSIVAGEQHHPGFEEALDYVSFQDAVAALVRQRHVGGRGATVTTHRRGGTP